MSRTWKKVIALVMIICMTAMFAACDSGDDDGSGENKTSQTTPGGTKAAKTLTGTGRLTDTPTPTPTAPVWNTPTPTVTVRDVTPTDTVWAVTPTTEITPTQQVTPTWQVTPVLFDDDPDTKYEIVTTPYPESSDTRLSYVSITRTTDKGSEKVFDSEEYIKAHKAEWEAEAASRIRQVENDAFGTRNADSDAILQVFVNERQESRMICGSAGLLEVYSHAGAYGELYEEKLRSAYTVSCWLVLPDMTKRYMVLYEYMPEKKEGNTEKHFSFEQYYGNASGGKDPFDAEAVRKVLTVAEYREDTPGAEEWDDESMVWETYYASDSFGKLRRLVRWCCWEEGAAERSRTKSGWMFTSDNETPYNLMVKPWTVFDRNVLEIYDSMKQMENGEKPAIAGFADHVKNGVYSDSRILDNRYSLRATVEYIGEDVRTSLYISGEGLEIPVDESRCRLLDVFTSETGERLELCGYSGDARTGAMGSPEYDGCTDGAFIIRYYPAGAAQPSFSIDLAQYGNQNQEMFERDSAHYDNELWQKYNGPILKIQHVYDTYSLGSFGKLYIIGTACCGQVLSSHIRISGYEVDGIWVRDGALASQAWLYRGWGTNGTPEGARDYMNITFHMARDPEELSRSENYIETRYRYLKSYAPDFFRDNEETGGEIPGLMTMVCFGAEQTAGNQTGDRERYESVRAMFDPEGNYLLRVYASRHDSADCEIVDDGSVRDASGNDFLSLGTDGEWKVLSYTLKEIAAAFEKAADPNCEGKVAEGIMDHIFTGEKEDIGDYMFCDHAPLDDKTELFTLAVYNKDRAPDFCDIGFVIVRGGRIQTVEYMQLPFRLSGGE